jgi:membrane-associated protease RseP (regulator of RpoE activity)
MAGRLLSALIRYVDADDDAFKLIDGFALRDLEYWAKYPVGSTIDALGCICSYCDAKCVFCFRHSSPLERHGHKMLSLPEAQTLLRYYDIKKGVGLPIPLHDTGEVFLNNAVLDILKDVRARNKNIIINDLTTHGGHLSEATLDQLADLKPLFMVVSLNACDLGTRSAVMKQRSCERGLQAPSALKSRGIQYIGSIVPWPTGGIAAFEDTLRYLDEHDPFLIRVCLPSYTSLSGKEAPFDAAAFWAEIGGSIDRIRPEIRAPLLIQPSWYLRQEVWAHVDGVVRNSPAEWAGLRFGDRITEVEGKTVLGRQEAQSEILKAGQAGTLVGIEFERDGNKHHVVLEHKMEVDDDFYPYKPAGYNVDPHAYFGLHFIDSFRIDNVLGLSQIIKQHPDAERILLFTTQLAKPLLLQTMTNMVRAGFDELPLDRIRLTIAPHGYWGGNIVIGDIHVVGDFIVQIERLKASGYSPDLVLIPSSFTMGSWGLDILGQSFQEIERRTECVTRLIPTTPVKV